MTVHQLLQLIQQARDQAKGILRALEQAGHPQTNESSSLYLGLVTMQKRVSALRGGAPLGVFAPELDQLATMCTGKLEPLQVLIAQAAKVARGL